MSSAGPIVIVIAACFVVLSFFSFDSLEFQEIGLNYSWLKQSVEDRPYPAGRWYLGLGNHFIKFPRSVRTIYFVDDVTGQSQGPSLQSRTKDGLTVRLEVSFQYKLKFDSLYDLYQTLGLAYEQTMVRMAIESLTVGSTMYEANTFFANRSVISEEMHSLLNTHFNDHAFADVPFFQLRTVHLPNAFENAIQDTQVREQEIMIAVAEQKQNIVKYETSVIQAEQDVQILTNQAEAESTAIALHNNAFCKQYKLTQVLQSGALAMVKEASGWKPEMLLEYLRIRAVREHPSDHTMVKI
jgi:regulator of protease activity HflC (stomatin/prohibitin superfamily)